MDNRRRDVVILRLMFAILANFWRRNVSRSDVRRRFVSIMAHVILRLIFANFQRRDVRRRGPSVGLPESSMSFCGPSLLFLGTCFGVGTISVAKVSLVSSVITYDAVKFGSFSLGLATQCRLLQVGLGYTR
jgi:hypothetical protein